MNLHKTHPLLTLSIALSSSILLTDALRAESTEGTPINNCPDFPGKGSCNSAVRHTRNFDNWVINCYIALGDRTDRILNANDSHLVEEGEEFIWEWWKKKKSFEREIMSTAKRNSQTVYPVKKEMPNYKLRLDVQKSGIQLEAGGRNTKDPRRFNVLAIQLNENDLNKGVNFKGSTTIGSVSVQVTDEYEQADSGLAKLESLPSSFILARIGEALKKSINAGANAYIWFDQHKCGSRSRRSADDEGQSCPLILPGRGGNERGSGRQRGRSASQGNNNRQNQGQRRRTGSGQEARRKPAGQKRQSNSRRNPTRNKPRQGQPNSRGNPDPSPNQKPQRASQNKPLGRQTASSFNGNQGGSNTRHRQNGVLRRGSGKPASSNNKRQFTTRNNGNVIRRTQVGTGTKQNRMKVKVRQQNGRTTGPSGTVRKEASRNNNAPPGGNRNRQRSSRIKSNRTSRF